MIWRPAGAAVLALALTGCGDAEAACPAVAEAAHPNVLVQLAPGWPDAADAVVLGCDRACTEEAATLTEVLDDGVAWFDVTASPGSVVVTVLDRGGVELAAVPTELEFVRVHGPDCGGPLRATVTVPAP